MTRFGAEASTPKQAGDSVVELRQYTLHPGDRDTLIELFDRELVDGQEAAGMTIVGQFRDIDREDRFVWLRAFPDMTARARSLAAFYGGPTWARHRDAANATMIDSSDVLLLRAVSPSHGFARLVRPASNSSAKLGGVVLAGIVSLGGPLDSGSAERVAASVSALVRGAGGTPAAALVSEHRPNTFPALPVRETAEVFVWIATFCDAATAHRFTVDASLPATVLGRDKGLMLEHTILRLEPTERSALRG